MCTGCNRKIVFFSPIHSNPSPVCRSKTHPRQRSECTVTLIGWPIYERPIAAHCLPGKGRERERERERERQRDRERETERERERRGRGRKINKERR